MNATAPLILASSLLCACSSSDAPAPVSRTVDTGWVESRLEVPGGVSLRLQVMGSGPPLVIVHGGPALDLSYLAPGLEPLGAGYRVLLYDQRGTGGSLSPMNGDAINFSSFVEDIGRVGDVADAQRFYLMGHSWGALLSIAYALGHPDRVRGLILVGTASPGGHRSGEVAAAGASARTEDEQEALSTLFATPAFQAREPDAVKEMYRLSYGSMFADRSKTVALPLDLEERTLRDGFTVMRLLGEGDGVPDLWASLSALSPPTLLVHGSHDPMPLAVVQEIADSIPDASVARVQEAGHFPWIEQPGPFFATVRSFLEAH